MEKYPQINFDRIIFCGSIVKCDFPWAELAQRGQVRAVLNQYGSRDFWAAVVDWGVPDVCPSGRRGFESAGAYITQQRHPKFGHGDYFYDLNYEGNWLPFLQGLELGPAPVDASSRRNWHFRITVSILLLLLLSFAAFALELWVKRAPQDYFKVHKVGDSVGPEPWSYDFGDSNAWSIEKWTRPTHVGDGLIMQGPGVAMPDNLAGLAFYRFKGVFNFSELKDKSSVEWICWRQPQGFLSRGWQGYRLTLTKTLNKGEPPVTVAESYCSAPSKCKTITVKPGDKPSDGVDLLPCDAATVTLSGSPAGGLTLSIVLLNKTTACYQHTFLLGAPKGPAASYGNIALIKEDSSSVRLSPPRITPE